MKRKGGGRSGNENKESGRGRTRKDKVLSRGPTICGVSPNTGPLHSSLEPRDISAHHCSAQGIRTQRGYVACPRSRSYTDNGLGADHVRGHRVARVAYVLQLNDWEEMIVPLGPWEKEQLSSWRVKAAAMAPGPHPNLRL